jgi:Universal stress protein family
VLESAKVTGRKAGLKVQTRLIRTRSPGAAIVEEAQRSGAEIIYLGTAHAPPSERALGPTATYLLAHRPCRVVIETPAVDDGRDGGGGRPTRTGDAIPSGDGARRGGQRWDGAGRVAQLRDRARRSA